MKTKIYLIALTAAAGMLTACNRDYTPPPPTPQGAADSAAAAHDAAVETRDKFLASMDKEMADLDAKIDRLSNKSANATGDAKLREDEALANLRAQRDAVRKDYDNLKASTHDDWVKTKASFQSAWDNLVKSYDNAVQKITSS